MSLIPLYLSIIPLYLSLIPHAPVTNLPPPPSVPVSSHSAPITDLPVPVTIPHVPVTNHPVTVNNPHLPIANLAFHCVLWLITCDFQLACILH